MKYAYLSIISSGFVIIGYLPEIYITFYQKKNMNSAQYSSTIWLLAGIFGILYSSMNKEPFIAANYSINTFLNLSILILKIYYHYKDLNTSPAIDQLNSVVSLKIEEREEVLQM